MRERIGSLSKSSIVMGAQRTKYGARIGSFLVRRSKMRTSQESERKGACWFWSYINNAISGTGHEVKPRPLE